MDRRDGLPLSPERWDDCRFTELKDGRINNGRTKARIWYAPQVKRFVKFEVDGIDSKGVQSPLSRRELLNYQVTQ